MRRVLLTVAVLAATAYPLMNAYNVEPVRAQWSGKARPDLGVSQTVTCCWDELDTTCYVEPFSDCACALGARA